MLPEGQGQFIAGVGYSEGSRTFDKSGVPVPTASYRKADASGYFEYGLTPSLSLILAPTLAHEYGAPATNAVTGSDSSAVGARLQIFGTQTQVVAVQALMQPPIGTSFGQSGALDVRLMLGQTFVFGSWTAFVDIEPGVRARLDPYPNEARLDLCAGVRPIAALMVLFQDFNSYAGSSGEFVQRQSYSKAQLSIVYDVSRVWSVQIGGFRTIAGRNAIRETGPLVALWYRF